MASLWTECEIKREMNKSFGAKWWQHIVVFKRRLGTLTRQFRKMSTFKLFGSTYVILVSVNIGFKVPHNDDWCRPVALHFYSTALGWTLPYHHPPPPLYSLHNTCYFTPSKDKPSKMDVCTLSISPSVAYGYVIMYFYMSWNGFTSISAATDTVPYSLEATHL